MSSSIIQHHLFGTFASAVYTQKKPDASERKNGRKWSCEGTERQARGRGVWDGVLHINHASTVQRQDTHRLLKGTWKKQSFSLALPVSISCTLSIRSLLEENHIFYSSWKEHTRGKRQHHTPRWLALALTPSDRRPRPHWIPSSALSLQS